jgi:hypothetical protein
MTCCERNPVRWHLKETESDRASERGQSKAKAEESNQVRDKPRQLD